MEKKNESFNFKTFAINFEKLHEKLRDFGFLFLFFER